VTGSVTHMRTDGAVECGAIIRSILLNKVAIYRRSVSRRASTTNLVTLIAFAALTEIKVHRYGWEGK